MGKKKDSELGCFPQTEICITDTQSNFCIPSTKIIQKYCTLQFQRIYKAWMAGSVFAVSEGRWMTLLLDRICHQRQQHHKQLKTVHFQTTDFVHCDQGQRLKSYAELLPPYQLLQKRRNHSTAISKAVTFPTPPINGQIGCCALCFWEHIDGRVFRKLSQLCCAKLDLSVATWEEQCWSVCALTCL